MATASHPHPLRLGVDTGGTFTDFVLYDGERLRIHKVLSTPAAPEQAILQGIRELGLEGERFHLIHGSTVATNAVLEGKGVRTALITNRGFADLLSIGRQARAELYELQPQPRPDPVPAELCLETGGRISASGEELEPLSEADLQRLRQQLEALAPESVAINLLFSFVDDRAERAIEAALPTGVHCSRSSEVLPEYGEYERGIATWLNAYVGPLVEGYLTRLSTAVAPAPVSVMQSAGDTIEAAHASRRGVRLLLSGPAGGLQAAQFLGRQAQRPRLMSFDMGGTSTDVALLDGAVRLTSEGRIGDYPVAVPQVDMHTIGAGGGSIARVDAGGMLLVGPESAGADPGPACYGRGGEQPTVTDANLVLGRLRADAFLGGHMRLDIDAARRALRPLAEALGLSLEQAAAGIIEVANEHMARALRVISVERGHDPKAFSLISFGGAGGLHVCALAEKLGMGQAIAPAHAGVLSALGMLVAPPGREHSLTLNSPLATLDTEELEAAFQPLAQRCRRALIDEGVDPQRLEEQRSVDLRYQGQSFSLNLPWPGLAAATDAFHQAHRQRYGHALELPVELVNLRVRVRGPQPELDLSQAPTTSGEPQRAELAQWGEVAVWRREALAQGQTIPGPALITETVTTTLIAPGWRGELDAWGNLLMTQAG